MSKYIKIRLYQLEMQDIFNDGSQKNIEFVYPPSKFMNFVRTNIIADYDAHGSRAGDKLIVLVPQDYHTFLSCLRDLQPNQDGEFEICKMVPADKKEDKVKYVETKYEGTINDVLQIARQILLPNDLTVVELARMQMNFDKSCKQILEAKKISVEEEPEA